jgi:hypothetical protein
VLNSLNETDIDSTNIQTYGNQENIEYIYHYSSNGYHPLVLYNGLNGDIMKFEPGKGSVYTSNGIREFLEPVLKWLIQTYPNADILIRGDSGSVTPGLYRLAEKYEVDYTVRLKSNAGLKKLSEENEKAFQNLHGMILHTIIPYTVNSITWPVHRISTAA